MEIHVENIPASSIVYMRRRGAYGEKNFKLMEDMKSWVRKHNLWSKDGIIYGIAQDNVAVMMFVW